MTCSASYYLCDTLRDPWDVCTRVCVYVGWVGTEKIHCPSWESNRGRLSYI